MSFNKKQNKKTYIVISTIVMLILVLGGLLLWQHYHKKSPPQPTNPAAALSTPSPSQTAPSSSGNNSQGGVSSQSSPTTTLLPPASEWTTSSNGDITLQEPTANSTIRSGDTIAGLANVSTVQFILTDNSIGLIAQGSMTVTDGKFSGALQFTPHTNNGTLQVYYPNPTNGAEEDIVDINVNFNT